MHITLDQILEVFSTILAIVAFLQGKQIITNGRAKLILTAIAAAEHEVDALTYNDGTLDTQRVQLAVQVIQKLDPKINAATLTTDIEEVLAVIHEHAEELNSGIVHAADKPAVPTKPAKK